MNGYWSLLLLVGAGRFLAFLARMNIVPFYPELMSLFGMSYTGAGGLYSAFFVGYALSLVPAGASADRFPPARLIGGGLLLLIVSSAGLALAPGYGLALVARVLEGLAVALVYTASLKLVAVRFSSRNRAQAIGFMEVTTGLGMFTALTVQPYLSQSVSYRHLLLALPVLALFALPLVWTVRARSPATTRQAAFLPPLASLLNRDLVLLAATAMLGLLTLNGVFGWLPTYLTGVLGYERTEAGLVTSVILLCQMAGVYPGGLLSDRIGRRLPLVHAGTLLLIAAMLMFLFLTDGLWIYTAAVLMGLGLAIAISPLTALTTEMFGPDRAGLVASITIAISQAGSGFAGVLFGWVLDLTGSFRMVWSLAAALLLLRLVTTAMITEKGGDARNLS